LIENLYSPHMVVTYKKTSNSNKTKNKRKNTITMQFNISVTNIYYGLITWRSQSNKVRA